MKTHNLKKIRNKFQIKNLKKRLQDYQKFFTLQKPKKNPKLNQISYKIEKKNSKSKFI